ncbi:GNAT family N-acetyltransferase [Streptomyces sp. B6B3]|uniref:GNAT family N-acetyltransferase n=1 Tax=Streptomyces sp. B6B3 TaxID=3153570 RepID=UPI00325CA28E
MRGTDRLRSLDRLLPATGPLPDPPPGDRVVRTGDGAAVYHRHRVDPEAFEASWSALDQHQLLNARLTGKDPARAMDALLTAWERQIAEAEPSGVGADAEAVFPWPSRDTAVTPVLLDHGLRPKTIVAVRPAGRRTPVPPAAEGVLVRPMTPDDEEAAVRLWLEELNWDAQFGSCVVRPSSERNVRRRLAEVLRRERPWAWMAEAGRRRRSETVGMLAVEPPESTGWVADYTSARRPGYITHLCVTADHRGAGVGAALANTAHAALADTGQTATLLHYAALNPLSGPFWHRCGYRPLWSTWSRRLPR